MSTRKANKIMDKQFRTNDLPLAAFLVTTRSMPFLGCKQTERGKVSFLFDDPEEQGSRLAINFTGGAECPAAPFYNSIRYLRKVMDSTLEQSIEHEQCSNHNRS